MMFVALPIIVLLLAVGVALTVSGLSGRRVDDHPVCRRCKFDLFNRPADSTRCPECGADLARPRAIVDGRRERRRGLLAAGALLLAVALTLTGGTAYVRLAASNAQAMKPAWWLVGEIDSRDPVVAAAAAKELAARLPTGKLSQRAIDAAADRLLSIQGNRQATWDPAFGDFLEDARLANKLDDQRFFLYATQAPGFELTVRPRINRGDDLPFWIKEGNARVGSRATLKVTYGAIYEVDELAVAGKLTSEDRLSHHGGGATGSSMKLKQHLEKLADGPHAAHVVMTIGFHLASAPPGATPFVWTKRKLSAPFDLLPAEAPTVTVVRDESLRPEIERAITVERARQANWHRDGYDFLVEINSAPVDLGFDVFVLDGQGREHHASTIATAAKPNSFSGSHMSVKLPGFTGDKFDVVLKPSVAAAKGTVDVFGIWDGQVIVCDVPVKRLGPRLAVPPATTRIAP